jgi:hypothetical protein
VRYKNCVWWKMARDTKVVHSYWRNKEVMLSGYRCAKHDLPCVVSAQGKYGLQVEICAREVV